MVHKVLVPEANYTLLAGKQKYACCNIVVVLVIFFLAFTSIGLLAYNFFQTAINEEKLLNNIKIPSWMHWLWSYNAANSSAFQSTIKLIDKNFLVCYYTVNDSYFRSVRMEPSIIDPYLCTHIIVGFASVINCTIQLGSNTTPYQEVVGLKKINPNLKVMVSVGGADNDSGFDEMVLNHTNRKTFIRSVLNVTKYLNLDGLDLDWEFPGWAVPEATWQRIHFVQLAYELRKEFNHSGRKLILSAAVAAPQAIIDQSYEIPSLSEHVDFVNLMSYDYHFYVWYYPVTDLNSPLFPQSVQTGYLTSLNVNFSANYWVLKGMPRDKIVIGIPLYGHSYKLYNPSNHKLQAPARSYGDIGMKGFVSYPKICKFIKNGAVKVFVNDSYVPYVYKNDEWISYDDVLSVTYKAKWIKSNGFKGAMVFSLNTEDWNATCSTNRYPLTSAIKKIFN